MCGGNQLHVQRTEADRGEKETKRATLIVTFNKHNSCKPIGILHTLHLTHAGACDLAITGAAQPHKGARNPIKAKEHMPCGLVKGISNHHEIKKQTSCSKTKTRIDHSSPTRQVPMTGISLNHASGVRLAHSLKSR